MSKQKVAGYVLLDLLNADWTVDKSLYPDWSIVLMAMKKNGARMMLDLKSEHAPKDLETC